MSLWIHSWCWICSLLRTCICQVASTKDWERTSSIWRNWKVWQKGKVSLIISNSSHLVLHLNETLFSHDASVCSTHPRSAISNILVNRLAYYNPSKTTLATQDEHFGIVPIEAMAAHKPVVACNSGGPVESIKNGVTGYLCEPTPREFSAAMSNFVRDPQLSTTMGAEARQHVVQSFSTKTFGHHLNAYVVDTARRKIEWSEDISNEDCGCWYENFLLYTL